MDAILGAIKSKTMWAAVGLAALGELAGPVQDWITNHPGLAATLIGAVFAALRVYTTQSLAEKGSPPSPPVSP